MTRPIPRRTRTFALHVQAAVAVVVLLATPVLVLAGSAQASSSRAPISGSGSTWSANAIAQWTANIRSSSGIEVEYNQVGSSSGRTQFDQSAVDFAVSEIPYGLQDGGNRELVTQRPFAYMPIVAGGTSFMYNLRIGGQRVESLRLSGENVAKIFTGVITQWNDPAIQADNPGLVMPATRVVPVVRSDGSGTSAQFTQWMLAEHPAIWQAFCAKNNQNPCTQTSNYPAPPGSSFQAKPLSTGVTQFVIQPQAEGSITYVEYSYARAANFPVAKVLNSAGFYALPTAENVAVGLLGAQIETQNTDPSVYLTQKLQGVYRNGDPRAYPLSSYSYMILPTALDDGFDQRKANTLAAFASYFLCAGQAQAEPLGYSPLPLNLVQSGQEQIRKIPGVDPATIDLARCNNPTFSPSGENLLALNAPQPPACDQRGSLQCGTPAEGSPLPATNGNPDGQSDSPGTNDGAGGSTGGGGPGTTDAEGNPVAGDPAAAAQDPAAVAAPEAAAAGIDPAVGALVDLDGDGIPDATGSTSALAGGAAAGAIPLQLASSGGWQASYTFGVLTVIALLGVMLLPPLLSRRLSRTSA